MRPVHNEPLYKDSGDLLLDPLVGALGKQVEHHAAVWREGREEGMSEREGLGMVGGGVGVG